MCFHTQVVVVVEGESLMKSLMFIVSFKKLVKSTKLHPVLLYGAFFGRMVWKYIRSIASSPRRFKLVLIANTPPPTCLENTYISLLLQSTINLNGHY